MFPRRKQCDVCLRVRRSRCTCMESTRAIVALRSTPCVRRQGYRSRAAKPRVVRVGLRNALPAQGAAATQSEARYRRQVTPHHMERFTRTRHDQDDQDTVPGIGGGHRRGGVRRRESRIAGGRNTPDRAGGDHTRRSDGEVARSGCFVTSGKCHPVSRGLRLRRGIAVAVLVAGAARTLRHDADHAGGNRRRTFRHVRIDGCGSAGEADSPVRASA